MNSENDNRLVRVAKFLLPFLGGVSLTLFVEVISDDLQFYLQGATIGWAVLWIISTSVSIPFGISALFLPSWRTVLLTQRIWVVMGFLLVGMVNILTMTIHLFSVRVVSEDIWWGSFIYGINVLAIYVYLNKKANVQEEIFP